MKTVYEQWKMNLTSTINNIKWKLIINVFVPRANWIPVKIRPLVNEILLWPIDMVYWLKGDRFLFPPRRIIYTMAFASKRKILEDAEKELGIIIKLTGMQPSWKVLDIGCGYGRLALVMTKYLNKEGSYDGIDIVPMGIKWCKENITPKYPNFNFKVAKIYNKLYNPHGKYKSSEYKFPYKSESFDLVFLISVFTHMLPEDVDNYLSQIYNVLKRKGICYATFFLLDRRRLKQKNYMTSKCSPKFKYDFGCFWGVSKNIHETTVAYDEEYIRMLYSKHNLNIEHIYYGSWRTGQKSFVGAQDVIIASKP